MKIIKEQRPAAFVILLVIIIMVVLGFVACSGNKKEENNQPPVHGIGPNLNLDLDRYKTDFHTGDSIRILSRLRDLSKAVGSVKVSIDGHPVYTLTGRFPDHFTWKTDTAQVGRHEIDYDLEYADHTHETMGQAFLLLSDIKPQETKVQILKTYSHDVNSYTQGLIYTDGIFYEGTGQYGKSKLRKIEPETEKVLKETELSPDYFGEGITLFHGKIYQLTWKSQIGFVYDPSTFEVIDKFSYPTEGWGLTHDDKQMILSDGTSYLYFYDEHFQNLGKVQVCDQNGPIEKLNELEYINGTVYANVYMTNKIVQIDPKTGKVTGRTVCENLLQPEDITDDTDVLNGIAWDANKKRLFITGKNWPKLFEVKLIPAAAPLQ